MAEQPLHSTEPHPELLGAAELHAPGRGPAFGRHGAIATAQPPASLVGIDVMRAGGNAIDAAIAASAVMVVVQPYSNHLGGDAFAIVRTADGAKAAVNAGGRAPLAATPDRFSNGIPARGPQAVAVPGLVDAWCDLHARFATRPLAELLAPASSLARDGFPISLGLSRAIAGARELLGADPGCKETFLSGDSLSPGSVLRQPDLARTLEAIAGGGREVFYGGETGRRIVDYLRERGGLLSEEDFASKQAVWGEPLRIDYRGWSVYEQPLPSQGFITLEALNIIEGFDLARMPIVSAGAVHTIAEALRLAFLDRRAHAGDPDAIDVPIERLLSKEHAAELRKKISSSKAGARVGPRGGDTTSFAVADSDGNAVTFIQSLFAPWGAAVLVPGTGVLLNNRMTGFSLDPDSPNVLRPGRRTMHTLNTWLIEHEDGRVFAGGTPGADFQVQINTQVIASLIDWGLRPAPAIDAPKFVLNAQGGISIEARFPDETFTELERRGHRVERLPAWATAISRAQIVGLRRDGVVLAASDLRAEGCALGW